MIAPAYLAFVALLAWLVAACLIPYLRAHQRPMAFWVMVLAGVPVLGWLTLHWGPVPGFGALAAGLWALRVWPVITQRRRGF